MEYAILLRIKEQVSPNTNDLYLSFKYTFFVLGHLYPFTIFFNKIGDK